MWELQELDAKKMASCLDCKVQKAHPSILWRLVILEYLSVLTSLLSPPALSLLVVTLRFTLQSGSSPLPASAKPPPRGS